jgi:hypothetical protein
MHRLLGNGHHFAVRTGLSRAEVVDAVCAWVAPSTGRVAGR